MPYYSVRFSNGHDPKVKAKVLEGKQLFNGRDPDHTGHNVEFYIERKMELRIVEQNMKNWATEEFEVEVRKITREEYNWMKRK